MNSPDWKYDPKKVGIDALTLRDFFAAQALNGILANPTWNQIAVSLAAPGDVNTYILASRMAYGYADAMLAVSTEKQP